ncbi:MULTISPECIES: hypothetical protein [unclassified Anaerobiospirillum]|uniref:hypothetical protein n=1 Tax=unclassified Anaerobiospirillum TaxID=2647410 RepID=UPI001FF5FA64|nr:MULTISPECIES: hypothetical protein [unclassified Anaerobiospirillum]MCK0527671.1 hypothetical protein [Anaerobiospirillum sp. NML120449]MCK0534401.1 hypothetical protein [Anaerobiospirillum sp. NML120511]MCK0539720.1 hypothetical protein [Anaerobiospirillum sp. NML02-A-032]
MSSITGMNSNFGFEALSVAMTKRATEAQGQAALKMLESTAQSVQQINASAPSAGGRVGSNIDVRA